MYPHLIQRNHTSAQALVCSPRSSFSATECAVQHQLEYQMPCTICAVCHDLYGGLSARACRERSCISSRDRVERGYHRGSLPKMYDRYRDYGLGDGRLQLVELAGDRWESRYCFLEFGNDELACRLYDGRKCSIGPCWGRLP